MFDLVYKINTQAIKFHCSQSIIHLTKYFTKYLRKNVLLLFRFVFCTTISKTLCIDIYNRRSCTKLRKISQAESNQIR